MRYEMARSLKQADGTVGNLCGIVTKQLSTTASSPQPLGDDSGSDERDNLNKSKPSLSENQITQLRCTSEVACSPHHRESDNFEDLNAKSSPLHQRQSHMLWKRQGGGERGAPSIFYMHRHVSGSARGGDVSAWRARLESAGNRLLGRRAAEQPASRQHRVDSSNFGAQPVRAPPRHQPVVHVREASGGPSPGAEALRPAEGQEAHRVAVERCVQGQRREQVGGTGQVSDQRRAVALTISDVAAAGHGDAVAPQQHRVAISSGDLRVGQAPDQRREPAVTTMVVAAGHGDAVAPDQDRMLCSSGDLHVGQVPVQCRELARTIKVSRLLPPATATPSLLSRTVCPYLHIQRRLARRSGS